MLSRWFGILTGLYAIAKMFPSHSSLITFKFTLKFKRIKSTLKNGVSIH